MKRSSGRGHVRLLLGVGVGVGVRGKCSGAVLFSRRLGRIVACLYCSGRVVGKCPKARKPLRLQQEPGPTPGSLRFSHQPARPSSRVRGMPKPFAPIALSSLLFFDFQRPTRHRNDEPWLALYEPCMLTRPCPYRSLERIIHTLYALVHTKYQEDLVCPFPGTSSWYNELTLHARNVVQQLVSLGVNCSTTCPVELLSQRAFPLGSARNRELANKELR